MSRFFKEILILLQTSFNENYTEQGISKTAREVNKYNIYWCIKSEEVCSSILIQEVWGQNYTFTLVANSLFKHVLKYIYSLYRVAFFLVGYSIHEYDYNVTNIIMTFHFEK